jgi:D-sedoheptulose 7-phosphate isomerase
MTQAVEPDLQEFAARRARANELFFESEAKQVARLCHRMAERFARGGRLIALGTSPAARSDARHVAVEFVHPVIVGKRALPALGVWTASDMDLIAAPDDMVLVLDPDEHAVRSAAGRGCLTIGICPHVEADWNFVPPTDDPFVAQELVETLYHVLWELVHVFFEHRGLLAGRAPGAVRDTGASSFLYPFLGEREHDLESVLEDVRRSVTAKAEEVAGLRSQTLSEGAAALAESAASLRACFDAGGKLLALGNGGSATDAMDLVADFRSPPRSWPARRAIDLTEDPAILTAIANDIGVEAMFARQVIAYGQEGDVLVAISTSGNSANVIAALAEGRRRGLETIALVGYDGGRVAAEHLADHVIVTRSQHIPRIQEAQASAYHVLRELVEVSGGGAASGTAAASRGSR